MTTESVKAILDGRKTMTRRVITHPVIPNSDIVGLQEYLYVPLSEHPSVMDVSEGYYALLKCNANQDRSTTYFRSPYGQVGDRLWERETWAVNPTMDEKAPRDISTVAFVYYKASSKGSPLIIGKWRPSIFMPRWASRITLEITGVRVERLQEISQEDIKAEGIVPYHTLPGGELTGRYSFQLLWDSLNAKRGYGWETNPWVWVIKFDNIGVKAK